MPYSAAAKIAIQHLQTLSTSYQRRYAEAAALSSDYSEELKPYVFCPQNHKLKRLVQIMVSLLYIEPKMHQAF
jgi:hypothetical protein